jgi:hypothetical protein
MIGIETVRRANIDASRISRGMERGGRRALKRYGGYLRKVAQRRIRRRKRASRPGESPTGHGNQPLKRGIRYALTDDDGVIIGPEKTRIGKIAHNLEYGGMMPAAPNPRRTRRRIGDGGELSIGKSNARTNKRVRDKDGKLRWVTYIRLATADQVHRANEINEALYGPDKYASKKLYPRPFMRPAQATTNQALVPQIFKDTLR